MADIEQLKEVLKNNLERTGALNKIRSSLRAEIYRTLDDETLERPPVTGQQLLINEMIREYFEFIGYKHALSVFMQESGQPTDGLEPKFIASQLNIQHVHAHHSDVPLLYSVFNVLSNSKNNIISTATTPTSQAPLTRSQISFQKSPSPIRRSKHSVVFSGANSPNTTNETEREQIRYSNANSFRDEHTPEAYTYHK